MVAREFLDSILSAEKSASHLFDQPADGAHHRALCHGHRLLLVVLVRLSC